MRVASLSARHRQRFTGQLSLFGALLDPEIHTRTHWATCCSTASAQDAYKRDVAGGFQAEGVLHVWARRTPFAPVLIGEIDRSTSDTTSQVILL